MDTVCKILVVEDNDFVRMQIVAYLRNAGHDVVEAAEGEAALDAVTAGTAPDLAIVDVRMEPVDGFAFIKALRGKDIKTPVILVTGDQTSDILEQAGHLGVGAVLMKPVEKDRFLKTVARTIERSKRLA